MIYPKRYLCGNCKHVLFEDFDLNYENLDIVQLKDNKIITEVQQKYIFITQLKQNYLLNNLQVDPNKDLKMQKFITLEQFFDRYEEIQQQQIQQEQKWKNQFSGTNNQGEINKNQLSQGEQNKQLDNSLEYSEIRTRIVQCLQRLVKQTMLG
ncbi:hypothetical protein PPERSA_06019 [Pseudocohnilembus persalinus]|uniref:Uncharacterized protein n=1 Tax=Pseudocohnilembus persalinus TaxID=266149 RepID=A0A0V0QQ86_PSEPJ|nr:hypothetical protein PPERSA_06019 [Pseudocohnilembus persalinus]|eukprot:KRX04466.1 hypothetical protein PPERSA_06019 [Pseudocohnilembus persalinus]